MRSCALALFDPRSPHRHGACARACSSSVPSLGIRSQEPRPVACAWRVRSHGIHVRGRGRDEERKGEREGEREPSVGGGGFIGAARIHTCTKGPELMSCQGCAYVLFCSSLSIFCCLSFHFRSSLSRPTPISSSPKPSSSILPHEPSTRTTSTARTAMTA